MEQGRVGEKDWRVGRMEGGRIVFEMVLFFL